MTHLRFPLAAATLVAALTGQTTSIFPADYVNVPEGPLNSPNFPLAYGTSRVQVMYDVRDLDIPSGHQITAVGFREDGTLTTMEAGRTLQLEIRMGYTSNTVASMGSNFDNNYVAPPTTVFGPTTFTLPNLRDTNNPLTNGQFFIPLTTPFTFSPSGSDNLVVEYRVFGNSGGGTSWNYRLDRADYYSPTNLGPAGCVHSGNHPTQLSVTGARPGQSYSANVSQGPGNSLCVLLVTAFGQLTTPYPLTPVVPGISPTCMGQIPLTINPFPMTALTSASGSRAFSFTIPNNQELYGKVWIASQAVVFDFFAPGGVAVSNGAEMQLGRQPRMVVVYAAGPPTGATTGSVSRNYGVVSFFTHQ